MEKRTEQEYEGIPYYVSLDDAMEYQELRKLSKEQLLERHWIRSDKLTRKVLISWIIIIALTIILLKLTI